MMENLKPLGGCDNRGKVFCSGDEIVREIYSDYLDATKNIYDLYKKYDLKNSGIVKTEWHENNEKHILKHQKHLISYPHEWTPNMFKDVILLHLDLLINLDSYGLTLKDAVPNNIVFNFSKPVFVDFLSILPIKDLENEEWLFKDDNNKHQDLRFHVFEKMFIPYFLIPFIILSRKNYSYVKNILFNKACNSGNNAPNWHDIGRSSNNSGLKNFIDLFLLKRSINKIKKDKFINFCLEFKSLIEKTDINVGSSDYSSYYDEKSENFNLTDFDNWQDKQKSVYKILKDLKPKTVLDLGANTGWFSLLSEKMGANVIATDIDIACLENIYSKAKKDNLKILPLDLSFTDLTKKLNGLSFDESSDVGVYDDKNPIFLPATDRLQSDLVLCLALIHHLVLGMGNEIEEVIKTMAALTNKILILEFVGFDDEKVKQEPTFYANINKFSEQTYNLDIVMQVGRKYFREVEILSSHPETRKLLILRK